MTAAWLPPEMSVEERDEHTAAATDADGVTDWHLAAALAWESWAAQITDGQFGVSSVSTGAQSVTYSSGTGGVGQALARARFHRARMRITSVPVGPQHEVRAALDRLGSGDWPVEPGWRRLGVGRV